MTQGLLGFMPDGRYAVAPTGKSTRTGNVDVMRFADGTIAHMTEVWNAPWARRELGWAA